MTAHELILAYYDAVVASREPLLECSQDAEWCEAHEEGSCYYGWRNSRNTPRRPTAEEMADWCPACRANEEIIRRRCAATRKRGAMLRAMQQYAKRLRGALQPTPEPGGVSAAELGAMTGAAIREASKPEPPPKVTVSTTGTGPEPGGVCSECGGKQKLPSMYGAGWVYCKCHPTHAEHSTGRLGEG